MKKLLILALIASSLFYLNACGGGNDESSSAPGTNTEESSSSSEASSGGTSDYDPTRGEGKWDESNVDVSVFDAAMAAKGKQVAEVKCFSCHKITDEKLVGPGWKGVSQKELLIGL